MAKSEMPLICGVQLSKDEAAEWNRLPGEQVAYEDEQGNWWMEMERERTGKYPRIHVVVPVGCRKQPA